MIYKTLTAGAVVNRNKENKAQHLEMHQEKTSRKCSWKKRKSPTNVKVRSLSHSTKQGNSNNNISNRVEEMGDNISSNNRGHQDKKMLLF